MRWHRLPLLLLLVAVLPVAAATAAPARDQSVTDARVESSFVAAGGGVYVAAYAVVTEQNVAYSQDATLVALDPATGTERWRFATGARWMPSPVVADGLAYVHSATTFRRQQRPHGHALRRRRRDRRGALAPRRRRAVLPAGGRRRRRLRRGRWAPLRPRRGERRRALASPGPAAAREPARGRSGYALRRIFQRRLRRVAPRGVRRRDGRRAGVLGCRDRRELHDRRAGDHPAVADGVAYVVGLTDESGQGGESLAALDAATGAERWRSAFGAGGLPVTLGVHAGTVYATDFGALHAVDAAGGAERWSFGASGIVSPAVAADGTVYVASTVIGEGVQAALHAIDDATGPERWRFLTEGVPSFAAPNRPAVAAAEGVAYVGGGETVYAVDATSGTELWRSRLPLTLPATTPEGDASPAAGSSRAATAAPARAGRQADDCPPIPALQGVHGSVVSAVGAADEERRLRRGHRSRSSSATRSPPRTRPSSRSIPPAAPSAGASRPTPRS